MRESEFDKFADEYTATHATNVRITGERPEYFAEYKIRDMAELCKELKYERNCSILDFGAGIGSSVPFWSSYFPASEITCLDVSKRSIEIGESRIGDRASFVRFDGKKIPFPAASFDIAFAACVFHHIEHSQHLTLFQELKRVLKPNGIFMVYEHNPYNPLTRHAVNTCPFDENASLIRPKVMSERIQQAGFYRPAIRYRVFFPKFLDKLRFLENRLMWLPFGAQYYVCAQNSQ